MYTFRLEAIAVDAELQEKSLSELERLADILHESCVQAEDEHMLRLVTVTQHSTHIILILITMYMSAHRIEDDPNYDPKKDKGATLRLCGVTISCSSILKREEELSSLVTCLPANPAVRKK